MVRPSLANFRLPPKQGAPIIIMRSLPSIVEIEEMAQVPGADWRPDFEAKCAAASLPLFGITVDDTKPPEPHPDSFGNTGRLSSFVFEDKAFASYNAALGAWHSWMASFEYIEADIKGLGAVRYWMRRGIDISAEYTGGDALKCYPHFERQMIVSVHELLPGVRFTPDASGKRPAQSVEEWGAALAAEAKRFKPSR